MNGQFTLGSIRPDRYFLTIAVSLGLMFFFVGPDENSNGWSLFWQWQVQTVGPMLLMIASHLVLHRFGALAGLNPWLKLVISGALGATLFSPIALLLDVVLQGETLAPGPYGVLENLTHEIANFVPPVVFCWVVINAPWMLGWRFEQAAFFPVSAEPTTANSPDAVTGEAVTQQTGLVELLPQALGNDIVMMKSELHYLMVHTSNGKTMVLYNLKDAVKEQAPDTGFQCHRSYWVNRKYVKQLHRVGRQGNIELTDGTLVPVSRNYVDTARTALSSA